MIRKLRYMMEKDDGVSPVIGTILMVAVTVVLGATVYALMNGFGDDAVGDQTNAAWKAQAIDTDNNGATDRIKITYVTGPSGVSASNVNVNMTDTSGTGVSPVSAHTGDWNPGDSQIYDPSSSGTYFTTVRMFSSTILDQSVYLDE